jgi:hypothetical protein
MTNARTVEFDLDRYLCNSKKVDLSGIEWDEIPNHTLSDGDVMCLHYMMDIEAQRPRWAGVTPMPAARRDNGHPPAPTHWAESKDGRPDVMSATSDVERREEERAAHVMRIGS